MRILMVTEHCCPRVLKEAVALRGAGHWVGVLTNKLDLGHVFDGIWYYNDPVSLEANLRRIECDVIHVHNEPLWPCEVCINVAVAPVVFDIHDLDFVRWGRPPGPELTCVAACDGVIVPSESYRAAIGGVGEVVYSMPMEDGIRWADNPLDALVMEGHASVDKGTKGSPWLDYREVALRFAKSRNQPLFIQTAEANHGLTYYNSRTIVMESTSYDGLCDRMPHFRWGLVSGGCRHAQCDAGMPNKLFEYLTWGVVPVVMWEKEVAEFVEKYGVGIVADSPEDAAKKMTKTTWQKCRKAIKRLQHEFTMESQLPKIEAVYATAVGN